MEVLRGGSEWRVSVEGLHGGSPSRFSMEGLRGRSPWRVSMEGLQGRRRGTMSAHVPMIFGEIHAPPFGGDRFFMAGLLG